MSNVVDIGQYRRRKGNASVFHMDEIRAHFERRTAEQMQKRLAELETGRPFTPENDDMRELLNARLGVDE